MHSSYAILVNFRCFVQLFGAAMSGTENLYLGTGSFS